MVRIPLYLAVAQWALLGGLGIFVFLLFRQLGELTSGSAKAAGLGPVPGSQAAPLNYVRPGEPEIRRLRPGAGQPLLLAFVDPTCPSCEELVRVLGSLNAAGELAGVRILLLVSDPVSYLRISPAFEATELEIGRPRRPNSTRTGSRRRRCSWLSTGSAQSGRPGRRSGRPKYDSTRLMRGLLSRLPRLRGR